MNNKNVSYVQNEILFNPSQNKNFRRIDTTENEYIKQGDVYVIKDSNTCPKVES